MQHSTGQHDDLALVPRARPREGCRPRTTTSRHRRHSPPRCSCRVVPPIRDARFVDLNLAVSHVQLSPAPGTGLQSPETDSQNRGYRDLNRRQRPHVPHLNPRKRPQIAGYLYGQAPTPHTGAPEARRGLRTLPQSSSDIMQKGLDFVREQSGTVTPPDPGVPLDPAPPAAWLKVELPALETGTGRMGSLAFKYLHGGQ